MDAYEEKEYISVKEYAALHHVSESSVYAKMRRKTEALRGHIRKEKGVTVLDKTAQQILKPYDVNKELAKQAQHWQNVASARQTDINCQKQNIEEYKRKIDALELENINNGVRILELERVIERENGHGQELEEIKNKLDEILYAIENFKGFGVLGKREKPRK